MWTIIKDSLRGARGALFTFYLTLAAEFVLAVYTPLMLSDILSRGTDATMQSVVLYLLLALATALSFIANEATAGYAANAIAMRTVNDCMGDYMKAPLADLYKAHRLEAFYAINNMSVFVPYYLLVFIPKLTLVLIRAAVILLLLARMNIAISVAAVAAAALQFLIQKKLLAKVEETTQAASAEENGYQQDAHDVIAHLKSLKVHSMERPVMARIGERKDGVLKKIGKKVFWDGLSGTENMFVRNVLYLAAVVVVCMMLGNGRLRLGDYEVIIAYTLILISAIEFFFETMNFGKQTKAMYAVYNSVMLEKEATGEHTADRIGQISISDMSYGYDEDKTVIGHFSHVFEHGKMYVIKGGNGSGKSTLINLITGLLTPEQGTVTADGIPLGQWEKYRYLQQHFAVSDQNTVLFFDRMEDDITLGEASESVEDYKKEWALDALESHEDGAYSGGEKQKIGLARMQYRMDANQADILVLDEPFNHLDTDGKERVLSFVRRMKGQKMIFVIAHDDAFDGICDEVIQMS